MAEIPKKNIGVITEMLARCPQETLTEEEWDENRKKGVGASEVAAIMGESPWDDSLSLWNKKRNGEVWEDSVASLLGHDLEERCAQLYSGTKLGGAGRPVYDLGDYVILRYNPWPKLFTTLDRLTIHEDGRLGVVEGKTTGIYHAEEWREGVPPIENQIQLQVQMGITGCEWGSLACIVSNREFYYFDIEFNAEFFDMVVEKVKEFWEYVESGEEPPATGTVASKRTLAKLHPKDNGEVVYFEGDISLDFHDWCSRYEGLKEEAKNIEGPIKEAKNKIIQMIGDNSYGATPDESVLYSHMHQTRKGHLTVSTDKGAELAKAGIDFKQTKDANFRVLRKAKNIKKFKTKKET